MYNSTEITIVNSEIDIHYFEYLEDYKKFVEISIVVPSGVNPDAESSHSRTELKCKNGNMISFTFPTAIGLFDDKYQYMQGGWSESKIAAFQQSIKNRFGTAENIEKQGKR